MNAPIWEGDLFSDELLRDPWPTYNALLEHERIIRSDRLDAWIVARHADCRAVLRAPELFVSGQGVGLNDACNALTQGSVLGSDRPLHPKLKWVLLNLLSRKKLKAMQPRVAALVARLVARLVDVGDFDGLAELTQSFPMSVVCDFIGFPEEDRHHLLPWASASFDFFGPPNPRCLAAELISKQAFGYVFNPTLPARLPAGSAAAEIFAAVGRGELTAQQGPILMMTLLTAALDTTIASLQHLLRYIADNPDQWALVRADRSLIPNAYNEVLRLGTPVRGFARVTSRETRLGGVDLPHGARVFLLFAAANRDPRRWRDPHRFDVMRDASGHLSFGHGVHLCAGAALARLEAHCLMEALAERVGRIELSAARPAANNLIQAHEAMTVSFSG